MDNDDEYHSDDEAPILLNLGSTEPATTQYNCELNRQSAESSPPTVVPVTILTGFLGSGKTTLIQYILRSQDHGKRIAIIENEFSGASAALEGKGNDAEREGLSIETLIARDGSNNSNLTDLIELPNGCICCTVKDSLVETLEALLEKKKELDYIIIECSGMANPGPIASIFWLDEALESRLKLDGIVACVDARNFESQLSETTSVARRDLLIGDSKTLQQNFGPGGDEAAQQVAFADRIIVNKVDLLDKNRSIEQVVKQIRAINPTAPILRTTFSKVPELDWVLDANCFDIERVRVVESTFELMHEQNIDSNEKDFVCSDSNCFSCSKPPNGFGQNIYCSPCTSTSYNHIHTNAISTIAMIENGSVQLSRMNSWLASILWPDQDKEDNLLKAELEELERMNQITIPDVVETRRKDELMNKMHIFRIKGIISVQHDCLDDEAEFVGENLLDTRKFIVQAVNDLWEIHPSTESWKLSDKRICKLVVIGRNLNREELSTGYQSCISMPNQL